MEDTSRPRKAVRVALIGKSSMSKRSVARYLQFTHGFKRLSCQDSVRKVIHMFYRLSKNKYIKWEKRLAFYDALYSVDNDIWVNYLLGRAANTEHDIIVPDVRYIYEIQQLRKAGFIVVRIVTPNFQKTPPYSSVNSDVPGKLTLAEYYGYNKNMQDILGVEYNIIDTGDKEALRKGVDNIVNSLHRRV